MIPAEKTSENELIILSYFDVHEVAEGKEITEVNLLIDKLGKRCLKKKERNKERRKDHHLSFLIKSR